MRKLVGTRGAQAGTKRDDGPVLDVFGILSRFAEETPIKLHYLSRDSP